MTVEIEVNALSAKPLGQIAPQNLADLFALEEKDDLPAGLRVRLKGFRERMARAIGDLPNGAPFLALLDTLRALPAEKVPTSLREVLVRDVEDPKRSETERVAVGDLRAVWAENEPEPFQMAAPVYRAPGPVAGEPRRRRPEPRREREARKPAAPRTPRTVVDEDPERTAWVRNVVLERLALSLEQGLLQAVLLAGVKHRARERYPDLTPQEVMAALRQLEAEKRARQSAGRWKLLTSGF